MNINNQQLFDKLKELSIISEKKLDAAFEQSKNQHIPLSTIVLEQDFISDENLGKLMADMLSVPFVRLKNFSIKPEILNIVTEEVARAQRAIVFDADNNMVHLALAEPDNEEFIELVKKKTQKKVVVHYATVRDIQDTLNLYSTGLSVELKTLLHKPKERLKEMPLQKALQDIPVIQIIDTIIDYGYQSRASDIHIEVSVAHCLIRFRVDGLLHDVAQLPRELHAHLVTRVKVLSKLRTDEHQAAQDGKIQFPINGEKLDIRVSIVPTTEGETVALRLLSERSREFGLHDLGLDSRGLKLVERAYKKPYGMVLATGPTGSGKTTTMYAILKLLNKRDVNIMTIEDPVEYHIEGVNQLQANSRTNLTFANGLRSIVRQDPDIILVGEIRDRETADIAVNAATTGHLVLSTFHTNNAATTIPRLVEMGIEPFLITSTLNLVIAQRLVRKNHVSCRVSREVSFSKLFQYFDHALVQKVFGKKKERKTVRLYAGKGCSVCNQSGYEGRVALFEVLPLTDVVGQGIIKNTDASAIERLAVKEGMRTMAEDGLYKLKLGITSLEELVKTIQQEE